MPTRIEGKGGNMEILHYIEVSPKGHPCPGSLAFTGSAPTGSQKKSDLTQQSSYFICFLLLNSFIVQSLEENVQNEYVLPA